MPESHEGEGSSMIVQNSVTAAIEEGVSLKLEGINIDATDKEANTNKAQDYVYPEMWCTVGNKKNRVAKGSLTDLTLKEISYTHCALIMNMGPLFLMVLFVLWWLYSLLNTLRFNGSPVLLHNSIPILSTNLRFANFVLVWHFFSGTTSLNSAALIMSSNSGWDFLPWLAEWMGSRLDKARTSMIFEFLPEKPSGSTHRYKPGKWNRWKDNNSLDAVYGPPTEPTAPLWVTSATNW
ncbi:hypothetical protein B0H13DRAFT_1895116 [Mycena leptocephala]|nr:hypothetical protein B0H13DRAFT_1895116 [Mycena leptocephala]